MRRSITLAAILLLLAASAARAGDQADLDRRFSTTIHPFLEHYCIDCHGGDKPEGQFDMAKLYGTVSGVIDDQARWPVLLEKLTTKKMPPKDANEFPTDASRQDVIEWVRAVRASEIAKHAGDPGVVLARRLSNAEYNYTIRDLTGVDLRPAKEFPVDPANPAGFDNSGESLSMSPSLMKKYLDAAREVANHLVFRPSGLAFAPHPMLVETDREKYAI